MTAKKDTTTFIREAEVHFGTGKYTYEKTVYNGAKKQVVVTCPLHGDFAFVAGRLLSSLGCPVCSKISRDERRKNTALHEWIEKWDMFHGKDKFDYSQTYYTDASTPVDIVCKTHGAFKQLVHVHASSKYSCPKCRDENRGKAKKLNYAAKFKDRADELHNNMYQYSNDYVDSHSKVSIVCPIHGSFQQLPCNHLQGNGCPICAKNITTSSVELKLKELIPEIALEKKIVIVDDKRVEIDLCYNNIAIEVNGVYWHSDKFKAADHLINKTTALQKVGYQTLHFWDIEIMQNPNLVRSMILNKCGLTQRKIYARECIVKEVDASTSAKFLKDNHLQSSKAIGSVRLGLFHNNVLVSLMTFGKPRFTKNYHWELIRFAVLQDTSVVGGASKLLNNFKKQFTGTIVSYANLRYSNGQLYERLGFKKIGMSKPNYQYGKYGQLLSRYECQKHKLPKLLGGAYDPNLSESENMRKCNYHKISDCGNAIYVL